MLKIDIRRLFRANISSQRPSSPILTRTQAAIWREKKSLTTENHGGRCSDDTKEWRISGPILVTHYCVWLFGDAKQSKV